MIQYKTMQEFLVYSTEELVEIELAEKELEKQENFQKDLMFFVSDTKEIYNEIKSLDTEKKKVLAQLFVNLKIKYKNSPVIVELNSKQLSSKIDITLYDLDNNLIAMFIVEARNKYEKNMEKNMKTLHKVAQDLKKINKAPELLIYYTHSYKNNRFYKKNKIVNFKK